MTPSDRGRLSGRSRVLLEWLQTLVMAGVVFIILQTFVVQAFAVEGPSMQPTLQTGDRLLVNKFVYQFHPPEVGDIVVIRDPLLARRSLVKRERAVAGQRVVSQDGFYYVDGRPAGRACGLASRADGDEVLIPPNYIWVMGDNVCQSRDSRLFGPVPLGQVRGEVFLRFWPPGGFAVL